MKSKMNEKSYGIDIEEKLTSMLSDELAKSIDAQIIKELFAKQNRRKSAINEIFSIKN